jgi:hypothetical protein
LLLSAAVALRAGFIDRSGFTASNNLVNQTENVARSGIEGKTVMLQQTNPCAGADGTQISISTEVGGKVDLGGIMNDQDATATAKHALVSIETMGLLKQVGLGARRVEKTI